MERRRGAGSKTERKNGTREREEDGDIKGNEIKRWREKEKESEIKIEEDGSQIEEKEKK